MELEFGGHRYPVAAGGLVIGSGPECALRLSAPGVRLRHATVRLLESGTVVVAPAEPGAEILVNGAPLRSDPLPLKPGDRLWIGGVEIAVTGAGPAGAAGAAPSVPAGVPSDYRLGETVAGMQAIRRPPPPPMPEPAPVAAVPLATLVVKRGQRKGDRLPVRDPVTTIGRGDHNDIALPDTSLSASHARLQFQDGRWILTDQESTNGTVVNGQRVIGSTALSPGAEIILGEVALVFEPRDVAVAPRSPASGAIAEMPASSPSRSARPAALLWVVVAVVLLLAGYLLLT